MLRRGFRWYTQAASDKIGPFRRLDINNTFKTVRNQPRVVTPLMACCTAESYNFREMRKALGGSHQLTPLKCEDVMHFKYEGKDEVFLFENGSFVYWPKPSEQDSSKRLEAIKSFLKRYEIGSLEVAESEELDYALNDNNEAKLDGETLIVPSEAGVMTKLAFSNGLADSVKLASLEAYLQQHISKVKHIPSQLQFQGRIDLSRSEVLKLIGELLHFRAMLNLHSELIDTPELYWSEPALETLYLKTSRVLETRTRISILNKKMDYVNEMAQMLRSHLSEQHGLKLEWGIIALIAIEVAFEMAHCIV